MPKNSFVYIPSQQTHSMSPTHPHTVNAVQNSPDDDDDDDICPVCDGECTCSSNHPVPSSSPSKPVLKIRLTVPPALRVTKSQPVSRGKHIEQTTFATAHDGEAVPSAHVPKRRGRPPKNAPRPPKAPPTRKKPPPKPVYKKKTKTLPAKRKRTASNTDSSELTDIDDDDTRSVQFPTFVSASALSSTASSTDSDDSGGFDTDSSIEAEEENFILAEERARVRRELLGDDVPSSLSRRRDSWIIHPRKMSVGDPSDVDMDGRTEDEDDDDDDDGDEEDEDAAEEDEDGDVEEEDDEDDDRTRYTGMATGWSDGEESSFDADLFFANLSGSSSSSSSDDEDERDEIAIDPTALAGALASIQPRDLPFEVTEGWDGQLMFTSGPGGGVLEAEFDAMAAQFIVDSSASPSGADDDDDVNMQDADEEDEDGEDGREDGGDTTDEDLVGADDLPNERAMRLFNLPFELNVESINPLSTMSPIRRRALQGQLMGKNTPGDMLTGKMFGDFDDEEEEDDILTRPKTVGGPRQGCFEAEAEADDNKTVIIDNEHKPVPSPHPRTKGRGRGRRRIEAINRPLPQFTLPKRSTTPGSTTDAINALSITSPEPESGIPTLSPSIELDDVLDSAFLEGSSSEHSAPTPTTFEHMRNLTRWDLISVGAFRKTREDVGGWNSDTASDGHGYGGVMKSSPLTEMLWQNKMGTKNASSTGDGEKTRKEIRRERKLRRKAGGLVAIPKNLKGKGSGKLFHHHHPHHPNSKSRGSGSSQRLNFHQAGGSSPIA
ncbi:hypothetical protein EDD18DRAFT_1141965 [Armillaria luteobubalina]|uniref:Uncharacterized protein n=1 Tax=Armillaria luteobubalina TaxID=153913 RepID=A0AA39UX02_9AGAR|nr:hypothetical protein EDD18DRAFT_1141965 [Armillaria luteobubalina]